jgi:transcriptional regulator with XRE-family HTH domain
VACVGRKTKDWCGRPIYNGVNLAGENASAPKKEKRMKQEDQKPNKKRYHTAGSVIKKIRESREHVPLPPWQSYVRTPHLTQQEAAQQIYRDKSAYSKIERGLRKIDPELIAELIPILQLTPLQKFLLLAVSGWFPEALTEYLGLPHQLQDSFQDIDPATGLAELETFTQQQIYKACVTICHRLLVEVAKGDVFTWMRSLHKLNNLLNAGHRHPLDYILGTVVALISEAIESSSCSLYLFDVSQHPHKLILRASSDCHVTHSPPPPIMLSDESRVGKAAQEGRTVRVFDPDAGSDHLFMPVLAFSSGQASGHLLLGVISVAAAHKFSDDEVNFLELVCGLLAATYHTDANPKH